MDDRLSTTFAADASRHTANDTTEHTEKWTPLISNYHYLRGIDGRLPGDQSKDINASKSKKLSLARTRSRSRQRKA